MSDVEAIDQYISSELNTSATLLQQIAREATAPIAQAAKLIAARLEAGNKIMLFGNGGSAADAQHFAAELVGRYQMERGGLAAIALTTDTSILTSLGNDFGFEQVFARQVEALALPGDVVIGISTSGRSANVIAGLQTGRALGVHTIAILGANIIGLGGAADLVISVPSTQTPRIQEAHAVIIHILCDLVEKFCSRPDDPNSPTRATADQDISRDGQ
jgi:D-sedoheptulose 7-phosphate isomerase